MYHEIKFLLKKKNYHKKYSVLFIRQFYKIFEVNNWGIFILELRKNRENFQIIFNEAGIKLWNSLKMHTQQPVRIYNVRENLNYNQDKKDKNTET